jgi:hypothetical protein
MLANNFMTAVDLGISEIELRSLVKVLGMLERGEIPREKFHMGTTGRVDWWGYPEMECETPACICGWARHVSGVTPRIFEGVGDRYPSGIRNLFQMLSDGRDGYPTDSRSPEEAAIALRSYLTTGRPVWGGGV